MTLSKTGQAEKNDNLPQLTHNFSTQAPAARKIDLNVFNSNNRSPTTDGS